MHTLSSACLRLGGNSQDSLLSQHLHLHWSLRARPTGTGTHSVGSLMVGVERGSTLPPGGISVAHGLDPTSWLR